MKVITTFPLEHSDIPAVGTRAPPPERLRAAETATKARWRSQLAARLLQTTRKNVLEVALDTGYDSEAAFNRAFKREFGLPPGQYRKAHTGNAVRPVR